MFFSIQYEAAAEAEALLQKASNDVAAALQHLDSVMKTQFDYAHWQNHARDEYDRRYQGWTGAAGHMNTILTGAKNALNTITENYQQFDRSLSKGWQ